MKKHLLLVSSSLMLSLSLFAQDLALDIPDASKWQINSPKSSIILHLSDNFTPLNWVIGEPSGIVHFDLHNLEGSYFSFGFPINNLKTGSTSKRNKQIISLLKSNGEPKSKNPFKKEFFKKEISEVSFYTTKIEPAHDESMDPEKKDETRYLSITGDLTINNTTVSDVKLDATIIGLTVDPENDQGFICTIKFDLKFKLSDYQIVPKEGLERISDDINSAVILEIKRNMR